MTSERRAGNTEEWTTEQWQAHLQRFNESADYEAVYTAGRALRSYVCLPFASTPREIHSRGLFVTVSNISKILCMKNEGHGKVAVAASGSGCDTIPQGEHILPALCHASQKEKASIVLIIAQLLANLAAAGNNSSCSDRDSAADDDIDSRDMLLCRATGVGCLRDVLAAAVHVKARKAVGVVLACIYSCIVNGILDDNMLPASGTGTGIGTGADAIGGHLSGATARLRLLCLSRPLVCQLLLAPIDCCRKPNSSLEGGTAAAVEAQETGLQESAHRLEEVGEAVSVEEKEQQVLLEWVHILTLGLARGNALQPLFRLVSPIDSNPDTSPRAPVSHEQVILLQQLVGIIEDDKCIKDLIPQCIPSIGVKNTANTLATGEYRVSTAGDSVPSDTSASIANMDARKAEGTDLCGLTIDRKVDLVELLVLVGATLTEIDIERLPYGTTEGEPMSFPPPAASAAPVASPVPEAPSAPTKTGFNPGSATAAFSPPSPSSSSSSSSAGVLAMHESIVSDLSASFVLVAMQLLTAALCIDSTLIAEHSISSDSAYATGNSRGASLSSSSTTAFPSTLGHSSISPFLQCLQSQLVRTGIISFCTQLLSRCPKAYTRPPERPYESEAAKNQNARFSNIKGSGNATTSNKSRDAQSQWQHSIVYTCVRLLSCVIFRHKEAQHALRTSGGLAEVLSRCGTDFAIPLVREWALFAVRNACEDCAENRDFIEALQPQGATLQDETLKAQGYSVKLDANKGKFSLVQESPK